MTIKPAQSAAYLRPVSEKQKWFFFRWFNWGYDRLEHGYTAIVRWITRWPAIIMLGYAGLIVLAGWSFIQLPTGFLPIEDQGYFVVSTQLPDAAALPRTERLVGQVQRALQSTPGIENINAVIGTSVLENTAMPNAAACYVTYKDWSERTDPNQSQPAILAQLSRKFQDIPGATILAFPPPAIRGLGVSGGFQLEVQDLGAQGIDTLEQATRDLVAAGNSQSQLRGLVTPFSAHVPQIYLNIDRTKVKSLNLPLDLVFSTLQTYLGSTYVNDFNEFDRTYQVRVQADSQFRDKVDDIKRLEVRNNLGQMVPLGTLLSVEQRLGPITITRYDRYPAASITGQAAPGVSSGQALALMEETANKRLPSGMGYEWTTLAFEEKQVGNQAIYVFALAVLLVYLILAAKYESWLNPFAVILVVPLALLGTIAALVIRGMPNDIFAQIGIVLIIALASKNAILIVEFAQDLHAAGRGITEAAVEAAKERFRPILMTSFAFILGVVPLVIARGAGAASRQALGTAVFGGMIAATALSVFFVPVFYVLLQSFSEWWEQHKPLRLRND
ncbi:MAG TPA: efflux RND transporter permease subunit, partial [Pirellulales bacterium]